MSEKSVDHGTLANSTPHRTKPFASGVDPKSIGVSVGDTVVWRKVLNPAKPQQAKLLRAEVAYFTEKSVMLRVRDPAGNYRITPADPANVRPA